jgi:hypothetical protein
MRDKPENNKLSKSSILLCLQCFSKIQFFREDDDGVPPGCRHKVCPLSNTDNYINGNSYVKMLGHCGFQFFDENRSIFFGFASLFTIFTFILTLWGSFSLTTYNSVIQRVYWVGGNGVNTTTGADFSMYVGLRSFEYVNCKFVPGYNSYPSTCTRETIEWTDPHCLAGPIADACRACSTVATTMWATAFFSCFGLIFSFLGAQTRMRPAADIPVQKLLGVVSEFWGTISLAVALFTFEGSCLRELDKALAVPDVIFQLYVGPGLICYAICCISSFIRMTVHWVTPLPGLSGCCGPLSSHKLHSPSGDHASKVEVEMLNNSSF